MSWCVLVELHVCRGVYLLSCVSWCLLVGLNCVMVCTCLLVCHGEDWCDLLKV